MATQGASISWNSAAGGSWATGSVGYTAYYKVESVSSSSITLRGNLAGYDNSATDITLNTSTKVWSDGDTGEPHEITNSSTWVSQSSTTTSNLLYLWQGSSTLLGALEIPSWGRTGGGGFLSNEDPRFTNVSFTKTEDDHVTLTFSYDEMDGTLTNFVVHKKTADGTETNSSDIGISGGSGTVTMTGAQIPILDGLADGDNLWIEHSQNPVHIVFDDYGGIDNPYIHKIVDWSVENVNGVKSVVARFFGVDTGYTIDHYLTAFGPNLNPQPKNVVWDGTLKSESEIYKPATEYKILRESGTNQKPQYGSQFTTKGGKVFSNFW